MAENFQQSGSKGGGQPMNVIDTARAWARLYELKTGKRYVAATQSDSISGMPGPLLEIAHEVGEAQKARGGEFSTQEYNH